MTRPEPPPPDVQRIAAAQWLAYSDTREDVCPRDVPAAVLAYLGVNDTRAHFDVCPEPGNEGYVIRVSQNGWESGVPDPRRDD